MTAENLLRLFKSTGALKEGHFVLRSGLHSRQFFQCAHLLQWPVLSAEICAALAERARGVAADEVISPAMGGILVGHDVARHLRLKHIFAEKHEGALTVRRFDITRGARYLVCEDVVTTGSAVREVCRIVRDGGGDVAAVLCIVDRSGARQPDFGAPFISLLRLTVATFPADQLPPDLAGIPASKPGSK
ncbi:MAG: orotate phosphoribosyltransferase [Verrucomicrobiales bacterium]|jgi:orotate phosphoribosyltransferase|nr:orotate phosphoribosyltransferase [Verrucomicrobiales bacterium]